MKRCISMEWMWFLQFLFFELLWLAAVEIYNWCTSSAWSCTSQDHGVTRKKYVLWGAPRWCRAILVTLGWWLWYSVVTAASTTSSSYLFCCIQFVFTFLQLGATVRLNLHWAEDHGQWLEPISYRIIAVTGYIWMLLEVDLSLKYIEILIILLHAHTLSRNSASYALLLWNYYAERKCSPCRAVLLILGGFDRRSGIRTHTYFCSSIDTNTNLNMKCTYKENA